MTIQIPRNRLYIETKSILKAAEMLLTLQVRGLKKKVVLAKHGASFSLA
jgi:hypothetical protein